MQNVASCTFVYSMYVYATWYMLIYSVASYKYQFCTISDQETYFKLCPTLLAQKQEIEPLSDLLDSFPIW